MSARADVGVLRHGVVPYGQALAFQHQLRDRLVSGAEPPTGTVRGVKYEDMDGDGKWLFMQLTSGAADG